MKKKILIVDDIIENIQVIVSVFEKYEPDFALYQAINGELALKIAEKIKPDLIISDWNMPNMSGIELLKHLKKNIELKNIPVIMATGVMTTVEHLQIALQAGAVDYIRKPIEEVEIVARVHSALNLVESHTKILKQKNNELIENTLFLIRNNKFNVKLIRDLMLLRNKFDKNSNEIPQIIENIIKSIDKKIKTDSWKRFEVTFNTVHEDFYKNITLDFPNLTTSEIKLCAFLKLGLNSKDVAAILFISPQSVKVARSRLRKKLDIEKNTNLQSFFSRY